MTIRRPVITEKTLSNYKKFKKVTFEVDIDSDKSEIKKALETLYGVKVSTVKITNRLGKYKFSRYSQRLSKSADRKIAVATLKDGNIDLFEEK